MKYSINDYYAKTAEEVETPEVKLPVILINDVAKLILESMDNSSNGRTPFTKTEGMILIYLSENPGVTQLDISKATHLQPPTVSIKLKKMEEDGYIKRVSDTYDRRAVRVYLSEKGQEMYNNSTKNVSEGQMKLLDGISQEEINVLTAILTKMINNAKK